VGVPGDHGVAQRVLRDADGSHPDVAVVGVLGDADERHEAA